jgi:hypothetical protein
LRNELPPELSLGGPRADDDDPVAGAGVADVEADWGDPEVRVDRASAEPVGTGDERRSDRVILVVCAVVVAVALVVLAVSSAVTAAALRQQTCLNRAQYVSFADGSFDSRQERTRAAFAECGVVLPEQPDDGTP